MVLLFFHTFNELTVGVVVALLSNERCNSNRTHTHTPKCRPMKSTLHATHTINPIGYDHCSFICLLYYSIANVTILKTRLQSSWLSCQDRKNMFPPFTNWPHALPIAHKHTRNGYDVLHRPMHNASLVDLCSCIKLCETLKNSRRMHSYVLHVCLLHFFSLSLFCSRIL